MHVKVQATSSSGGLRRGALGPGAIVFFVVSAAGPLVAMVGGIPIAMLFGNGPGIPAAFLLASLILLAFSTGYTTMAKEVRNAGAFYAFAARGLGGHAAGATGMIALVSYNAIQIGLYGLFGAAAKGLIEPVTALILPWWLYAAAALGSVAFLGYRQVDLSARILGLLVVSEYLVVLVLDLAMVGHGGDAGLSIKPFTPQLAMSGSPAIGLMLCFSAFIGFEATTIYSEEARDPKRTIPRATYFSVLLIGGFYTFSTWAVVNGAGVEKLLGMLTRASDPTELLFSLSDRYVGSGLSLSMRILFVTSAYASLLAFHNTIARYLFAMGRERLLPARLGRTHARFSSPHVGSVIQTLLATVSLAIFAITAVDPVLIVFTLLSALATLGIVLLMATTSAAALRFLMHRQQGFVVLGFTTFAFIALISVAGIATIRFDLLAGSASAATGLLPLSLPAAAAVGILLAQRLYIREPLRYAKLGQDQTTSSLEAAED